MTAKKEGEEKHKVCQLLSQTGGEHVASRLEPNKRLNAHRASKVQCGNEFFPRREFSNISGKGTVSFSAGVEETS